MPWFIVCKSAALFLHIFALARGWWYSGGCFSFFLCKKPQFSGVDTRRICCVFSSSFLKKASISDDDDKYLDLFFSSASAFKLDCTLLLMRLLRSRYSRLIWPIYLISPLFAIVFAFPLVLHSVKCISRSAIWKHCEMVWASRKLNPCSSQVINCSLAQTGSFQLELKELLLLLAA